MPGGPTQTQNQRQSESGTQSQTQNQTQNVDLGPWGPTQGILTNIVNQLGGNSTAPTAGQTGALGMLNNAVSGLPNFGSAATGVANNLIGSTPQHTGMLSDAFGQASGALSPYLSSSYLDPMSTPGFSDALRTQMNDITNNINSQFAAAGRDLSPANTTALARGLSQGTSQTIADQFNRNVAAQQGAANALVGQAGSTASGLTGLEQAARQNQLSGLGVAGMVPELSMQPGQAALGVANTQYGLPYQNLGMLQNALLPIAGLGKTGTTTSSGTSSGSYSGTGNMSGTTQQQTDPLSNIIGGVTGGLGLLGSTGAFGSAGWLSSMLPMLALSDERTKEDIAPIGMLYDKTPVYSFRYKGDATPRVGLMAQDVEIDTPEAVHDVGGVKMVDYGKATERSRALGMLSDLPLAA